MRSRNYFAVSSLLVFMGLACDSGAKEMSDKRAEDKREEDRPEDTEDVKYEPGHRQTGIDLAQAGSDPLGLTDTSGTTTDSGGGQPMSACPKNQARLEDGTCAAEEEFFKEQEVLDEKAVAEMQQAKTPKQVAKAQGDLISNQYRQIEQAEKDLDEIIAEVKDRKEKSRKGRDDPFD